VGWALQSSQDLREWLTLLVGDDNNKHSKLVHVSRVTPFYRRCHGESVAAAPPGQPEEPEDDEERWEVERLMGRRKRRGKLEYLLDWAGDWAPSWEPADAAPLSLREEYDSLLG
jgi:hypothetical protein